jgi:hypothetical protein
MVSFMVFSLADGSDHEHAIKPANAKEPAPRATPRGAGAARPAIADTAFRALVAEARRRYEAALQAQREIDWARYGEEFRRLGELLEQLGTGGSEPQR